MKFLIRVSFLFLKSCIQTNRTHIKLILRFSFYLEPKKSDRIQYVYLDYMCIILNNKPDIFNIIFFGNIQHYYLNIST